MTARTNAARRTALSLGRKADTGLTSDAAQEAGASAAQVAAGSSEKVDAADEAGASMAEEIVDPRWIVHLVDDSAAMRATAGGILEGVGFIVREHASAAGLLAGLTLPQADCVLTDLRMPRIDGLELLVRLRSAGSTVPVVVMTGYGEVSMAVRAMKLGACDFIEKPFPPDILIQAVRSAVREARTPSNASRRALAAERLARLTDRERQVLERILAGRTHRETGDELGISPRTVEVFRGRIMAKTECETIQDLVRTGIEAGLG